MSKFLITLTPIDRFFFGGDMTFNVEGDEKHNEDYSSYIIKSSLFPQQTSLLGMLRFLLLRNEPELFDGSCIISNKVKEVESLIGPSSFSMKDSGKSVNDFGKIKSIHRCFVRCTDKDGKIHDLEWQGFDTAFKGNTVTDTMCYINGRAVLLPELKGFEAKKGYEKCLSSANLTKSLKDVFIEDRRIGISRDIQTGKTSDASLFKQISYRFNNSAEYKYCFAFYVELDSDVITEYSGQSVSVGADNSQFVISVSTVDAIPESAKSEVNKVVLKTPAYLSEEAIRMTSFVFAETIPFRFLETAVSETENYSILPRKNGDKRMKAPTRSRRYELYSAGSVLYFKDTETKDAFIAELESYKGFTQIGYNEI